MSSIHSRIAEILHEGAQLRLNCIQPLSAPLETAASLICKTLQTKGKVLLCGNGGSASDAQHFAAELVNRFHHDRPGLAAIALTHDSSVITSIANDSSFESIFSRQVEALGQDNDLLIAISTSGNSANVVAAAEAAGKIGMAVIAFTGHDGGSLAAHAAISCHIHIPHPSTARVQEMHITALHILCAIVDDTLFGDMP
ncbi:MAG: SIS domain-containing protein [Mariprofundaceae bacterium]